jgi:hypothetical protein
MKPMESEYSSQDLEIRRLRNDDMEGISHLHWEVFNEKKDPGYWHWKFYQNPAGEHMMMVACDDNRIVAMFGSVPINVKVGEKILLSSQGVDIVVSQNYRKLGVFARLEKATKELCLRNNIYFNYSFSIKATELIFSKLARFNGVCPVINMTKLINPTPYLQERMGMRSLAQFLGFPYKQFVKTVSKKKLSIPNGLKFVEVRRFDNRFDHFWHKEEKHYEISLVRNSQYLNWRYVQNPTPYKIFCVERNDCIEGFVILKCSQEDFKRGRIVDFFVQMEKGKVADLLLTGAMNYFLEENVDVVTSWMLEHWPIYQALKKRGFVSRNTPHDLIVRSLSSEAPREYFLDQYKWYLTMGDSDYY